MYKITVGKKWDKGAEYIGRGSPLGNPFVMQGEGDRDRVCNSYEVWIKQQIEDRNPTVMNELYRLYDLAQEKPLVLGCFCSPKRCHGDTIKAVLERAARS
jgi:hypothetical protein